MTGPGAHGSHQRVTAVVALTGPHRTQVEVRDPGTPEATASMVVGRAVLYLRTQAAAAQLGALADRAVRSVPRLPPTLPTRPQPPLAGDAQASIVTHVRGAPGTVVRLMPQTAPRTSYLHLQIGELVFHLHDRVAAHDCLAALRQVAALGGQLDVTDSREAATKRSQQPRFAGDDAERARAELAPDARRSSSSATGPRSFESPDATLARAEEALAQAQATISSVRRASAAFTPPPTRTKPLAAPEQRSAPISEPPPASRPDQQPNPGRNRTP